MVIGGAGPCRGGSRRSAPPPAAAGSAAARRPPGSAPRGSGAGRRTAPASPPGSGASSPSRSGAAVPPAGAGGWSAPGCWRRWCPRRRGRCPSARRRAPGWWNGSRSPHPRWRRCPRCCCSGRRRPGSNSPKGCSRAGSPTTGPRRCSIRRSAQLRPARGPARRPRPEGTEGRRRRRGTGTSDAATSRSGIRLSALHASRIAIFPLCSALAGASGSRAVAGSAGAPIPMPVRCAMVNRATTGRVNGPSMRGWPMRWPLASRGGDRGADEPLSDHIPPP